LGEYQTGWKIKTGNVLDSCNQMSTQQCIKSKVAKHLDVAGIHQQNELVEETNMTLLAKVRVQCGCCKELSLRWNRRRIMHLREQHSAWELFSYKEDSNEAAFAVAAVDKIFAH
nr:hypothetical protein [Tanacetum cinerariifolium]